MSRRGSKPGSKSGTVRQPVPIWRILTVILAVGVVANLAVWFWPREADASAASYPTYSAEQVEQGQEIFRMNCASCHGVEGQGNEQAGIPALNGSMHSWHHGDSEITGLIRRGGVRMPAIGSAWSDGEITAVLAYVKDWWTPQQREFQARVSRNNP